MSLVSLKDAKIRLASEVAERLHGPPDSILSLDLSENCLSSLLHSRSPATSPRGSFSSSTSPTAAGDKNSNSGGDGGNNNNNNQTDALTGLSNLKHLQLRCNLLRSLSGVSASLTVLVAPHNRLESLEGLEDCTHLRFVDVRYNNIRSLTGLPRSAPGSSLAGSAVIPSSFLKEAPAAVVAQFDPAASVVLLLSFNELEGAALAVLGQRGARRWGEGARRPWVGALTHLDLAHNRIGDVGDVCRSVSADPLHLRRLAYLDLSGNPFLTNGSLEETLTQQPAEMDNTKPSASTPMCNLLPLQPPPPTAEGECDTAVREAFAVQCARLSRHFALQLLACVDGPPLTVGVRGAEAALDSIARKSVPRPTETVAAAPVVTAVEESLISARSPLVMERTQPRRQRDTTSPVSLSRPTAPAAAPSPVLTEREVVAAIPVSRPLTLELDALATASTAAAVVAVATAEEKTPSSPALHPPCAATAVATAAAAARGSATGSKRRPSDSKAKVSKRKSVGYVVLKRGSTPRSSFSSLAGATRSPSVDLHSSAATSIARSVSPSGISNVPHN